MSARCLGLESLDAKSFQPEPDPEPDLFNLGCEEEADANKFLRNKQKARTQQL